MSKLTRAVQEAGAFDICNCKTYSISRVQAEKAIEIVKQEIAESVANFFTEYNRNREPDQVEKLVIKRIMGVK